MNIINSANTKKSVSKTSLNSVIWTAKSMDDVVHAPASARCEGRTAISRDLNFKHKNLTERRVSEKTALFSGLRNPDSASFFNITISAKSPGLHG